MLQSGGIWGFSSGYRHLAWGYRAPEEPKMPLTDTGIRKVKPKTPARMFDGRGLYLQVSPAGAKLWCFKYRFQRKEKLLALGAYPDVSLATGRQKRDDARKLLADGIDPGEHKRVAKAAREEKRQLRENVKTSE
jgi:hypothetical protein